MQEITTEELEHFLYHHHIIDIRERQETLKGMIPAAINIPMSELAFRVDELDKTITYTLICEAGIRSERACRFLEQQGFNTINVVDGMQKWDGDIT